MTVLFSQIFLIVVIFTSHFAYGETGREQKILNRLKDRKASYEQYQKENLKRDQQRTARIEEQKDLRKKYQKQREKARENFVRVETKIPHKYYLKFVEERDKEDAEMERAREREVLTQESIRETYEKSRFKIDKMKEYKL